MTVGSRAHWPYPDEMPPSPGDDPAAKEILTWVEARLAAHGFSIPGGPWAAFHNESVIGRDDAFALHATLEDMMQRCRDLQIDGSSTIGEHVRRWAFNREFEGIIRLLQKNKAPLDGQVFTRVFEWPASDGLGGAVEFYFRYASMRTLRSIDRWLHDTTSNPDVDVHERAFLLKALGRIDPADAVARARDLLDESPWATSEVLGRFGGAGELDLLRERLPRYRQRGMAEDRRRIETAIRTLERKATSNPK